MKEALESDRRTMVACVLIALLVPSVGWGDATLDAVRRAEQERQQALIAGDEALLDAILADDLTYAHSQGRVQTKAELMTSIASGRVRYRSIEVDDPAPRMLGESAAVVTSPVTMVVEAMGRTMDLRSRFLAVYGLRDGSWKLVAYQSTAMGAVTPTR